MSTMPEILPAARFRRCLDEPAAHRYFLDEAGAAPLLDSVADKPAASDRGCAHAWTGRRLDGRGAPTRQPTSGWRPASLGPLILRAETAAAAALAVVPNAWLASESLQ